MELVRGRKHRFYQSYEVIGLFRESPLAYGVYTFAGDTTDYFGVVDLRCICLSCGLTKAEADETRNILYKSGLIIPLAEGVDLIKHFRYNNRFTIPDRKKPPKEMENVFIDDEGVYNLDGVGKPVIPKDTDTYKPIRPQAETPTQTVDTYKPIRPQAETPTQTVDTYKPIRPQAETPTQTTDGVQVTDTEAGRTVESFQKQLGDTHPLTPKDKIEIRKMAKSIQGFSEMVEAGLAEIVKTRIERNERAGKRRYPNIYPLILKIATEDGESIVASWRNTDHGSFDTEDFWNAAVENSHRLYLEAKAKQKKKADTTNQDSFDTEEFWQAALAKSYENMPKK